MNVLMTADTLGGVFTHALELASALASHGVQVSLATKGGVLSPEQWAEARRVPWLEIYESPDRLEWMEDPWEDVARSSAWLLDLADRLRPDVVHLNDYAHGALPFGAPALVAARGCVYSWFEAVRRRPPPPRFARYRREVTRGLAGAGMVVAPTRWMIEALQRHYGQPTRWRVVPDGRSPERFAPQEKEAFILCAGRPGDEADNVGLLDAVAGCLSWPVLLAGAHPDPARGRAPARAPGGAVRHARALGRLSPDALACFFQRAAIFALPARYPPAGQAVLEAALAGCALVLGDAPALREIWGGAALFVDPDSPELLRAMLTGLVEREELRASLGALARQRARAFSPGRMAEGYLAAYRDLVAGRRGQAEAEPCGS